MESDISYGKIFGILDNSINKYRRREYDAKDIYPINKHLADEREATCGQEDERTISADTAELVIESSLQPMVRSILVKKEALLYGR